MMELALKLAVVAAGLVLTWRIYQTMKYGRRAARLPFGEAEFYKHKRYANQSFWTAVVAVVITEIAVRFLGASHDWVFWVHLIFFASPCLLLLVILRFWLTGLKNRGGS